MHRELLFKRFIQRHQKPAFTQFYDQISAFFLDHFGWISYSQRQIDQIIKRYCLQYEQYFFEVFFCSLIAKFIFIYEQYNFVYKSHLDTLIKRFYLTNKLTPMELSYLSSIEAILLTKIRHVKKLIVPFAPIRADEAFNFYYEQFQLFYKHDTKWLLVQNYPYVEGAVYLSNYRLIFKIDEHFYSFCLADLLMLKLINAGMGIYFCFHQQEIRLFSASAKILYLSLDRILSLYRYFI